MHELHARREHIHALLGYVREIQLDNLKASWYELQWFPLKLYKNLGLNDLQTFQTGTLLVFHSMPSFKTLQGIQATWEMSNFPPYRPVQLKSSHLEIRHQVMKLGPWRQKDGWMSQDVVFLPYLTRFGNIYIHNAYKIYKMVYKMIVVLFEGYFVVFWV